MQQLLFRLLVPHHLCCCCRREAAQRVGVTGYASVNAMVQRAAKELLRGGLAQLKFVPLGVAWHAPDFSALCSCCAADHNYKAERYWSAFQVHRPTCRSGRRLRWRACRAVSLVSERVAAASSAVATYAVTLCTETSGAYLQTRTISTGACKGDHHKAALKDHQPVHRDLPSGNNMVAFITLLAPLATLTAGLLVSSSIRGIVQGKSNSTARLATHLELLARENERLRQELRRRQKKAISEHQKRT